MSHFLAELDIDRAVDEFLRARGVGIPQPIVSMLDAMPPEDDDDSPDWDELTIRAQQMCAAPGQETTLEIAERILGKLGL